MNLCVLYKVKLNVVRQSYQMSNLWKLLAKREACTCVRKLDSTIYIYTYFATVIKK